MKFPKKAGPRTILIDLPQPCGEDWEQMQPVACGRFCGQCRKNLIDFTLLSDEQLAAVIVRKEGQAICGRFSATQLNRPITLPEPARETAWQPVKRMAAAALLLLPSLTATTASGQQNQDNKAGTTQSDRTKASLKNLTVSGRITDLATGDPLQGMEIIIGRAYKTYSDQNGYYSITLPASYAGSELSIGIAYQPNCAPETPGTTLLGERVQTDSVTQHYTVDLFRYPLLPLKKIEIKGIQRHYYTGIPATTGSYSSRPAKPGPWKRFKAALKKKKS